MNEPKDLLNALKKDGITLIIFRMNREQLYVEKPEILLMNEKARALWGGFLKKYTCLELEGSVIRIIDDPPASNIYKNSHN